MSHVGDSFVLCVTNDTKHHNKSIGKKTVLITINFFSCFETGNHNSNPKTGQKQK